MVKIYKIIFLFFLAGLVPLSVNAATLTLSPDSGEYNVDNILSVSVHVSSTDKTMNAASGIISFPQDKLEVISLSKNNSIFTLWVQEPSFSNSTGTVNFEGIILNPGFTGSKGKIITINFRIKAAGLASLNFSSSSVLANDGRGTNILTGLGGARFSFGKIAIPADTVASGAPFAPLISSSTHPDQSKWYFQKDLKFNWTVSSDVTAVRLLVNQTPVSVPTVTYTTAINEKEVKDFSDGVGYFHVQLRNANGWGKIASFKFQIDTKKPSSLEIREIPRQNKAENIVKFTFDAVDEVSGIDYYEIKIDGEDSKIWKDDGSHIYETSSMNPGKYILIARAFDKAGNLLTNYTEFTIEALSPPIITEYPKELSIGEPLIVRGLTSKNSNINILLKREIDDVRSFKIESDSNGKFTFIADEKLKEGIYHLWAETIDARGARSLPSEKITIIVAMSTFFRIGNWVINLLAIIIPLVVLIIALILILWYGWHKFSLIRKQLRKDIFKIEPDIHKEFNLLKKNLRDQIKMLEKARTKRQLTDEEEKIIKQFDVNLDKAEKIIIKEIEEIKKELK